MSDNDAKLIALIDQRIEHALEIFTDKLTKSMNAGFPDGDPYGHKAYHEAEILRIRAKIKMWEGIKEKTLAALLWSMILFAGGAILNYIRQLTHT